MTAPPDPQGRGGLIADLGGRLIGALPPAFLLLVLLNVAFLGLVMWFLDSQIDARTKLVTIFVDRCMADIGKLESMGAIEARLDALEHDVRAVEVDQRRK